jgi:hypothetical protein
MFDFVERRRQALADVQDGFDEFDVVNLSQNEALHQIGLRILIDPKRPSTPTRFELTATELRVSDQSINSVAFASRSNCVVAATQHTIFAYSGTLASFYIPDSILDNVLVTSDGIVLFTTSAGAVQVWDPQKTKLDFTAAIDSREDPNGRYFVRELGDAGFVTARQYGVVCIWDWMGERLLREVDVGVNVSAFDCRDSQAVLGCADGGIIVLNIENGTTQRIKLGGAAKEVAWAAGTIVARLEDGWVSLRGEKWERVGDPEAVWVNDKWFAKLGEGEVLFVDWEGKVAARITTEREMSSVTVHAEEPFMVLGTKAGLIVLYELPAQ